MIYALNFQLCSKTLTKMRLGYGNRVVENSLRPARSVRHRRVCPYPTGTSLDRPRDDKEVGTAMNFTFLTYNYSNVLSFLSLRA